jgi:hypothetical protein
MATKLKIALFGLLAIGPLGILAINGARPTTVKNDTDPQHFKKERGNCKEFYLHFFTCNSCLCFLLFIRPQQFLVFAIFFQFCHSSPSSLSRTLPARRPGKKTELKMILKVSCDHVPSLPKVTHRLN